MCSTPPSSTVCLRVWPRGDVSLLISSDTTLLTHQVSDKRFPDSALSRHRQLTRLFPVWAASEPAGWPARLHRRDTCDQTPPVPRRLSDLSQLSNTHEKVANCHPTQDTACDLHFHQLTKYQVWTCWAWNKVVQFTPQRQLLLTFESEHDYWTVRPHHCFGDKNKNCE